MLALAACGGSPDPTGPDPARLTIVTDIYPTAFAAGAVAGDRADVTVLAAPGVEPHDLELTPSQIALITEADLVAFVPGVIPAVADALRSDPGVRAVDVTGGIDLLSLGDTVDPHVWLDPPNVAAMGHAIADALSTDGLGEGWATDQLDASMSSLDERFTTELADCRIRPLVVSHAAFGYLAAAYGFEQHALSGVTPESEPSPATLAAITDLVRREDVTTIYHEPLAPADAAEAVAAETGAATAVLDPIESATGGRDYVTLMGQNLATLVTGQVC